MQASKASNEPPPLARLEEKTSVMSPKPPSLEDKKAGLLGSPKIDDKPSSAFGLPRGLASSTTKDDSKLAPALVSPRKVNVDASPKPRTF